MALVGLMAGSGSDVARLYLLADAAYQAPIWDGETLPHIGRVTSLRHREGQRSGFGFIRCFIIGEAFPRKVFVRPGLCRKAGVRYGNWCRFSLEETPKGLRVDKLRVCEPPDGRARAAQMPIGESRQGDHDDEGTVALPITDEAPMYSQPMQASRAHAQVACEIL